MRTDLLFDLVAGESRYHLSLPNGNISYAIAQTTESTTCGTIVLIHGVGSNASRWEEFTEKTELRKKWQLLRLDLRGHGASDSKVKATLEQHASDIVSVLDDVGVTKAILIGHSLGAQIAMQTAVLYPDRVAGVVLLDPLVTQALMPSVRAQKKKRWILLGVEFLARLGNAMGFERRLPHYSLRQHDQHAREMLSKGGDELQAFIKEYSSPLKDLEHIHTAHYVRDLLEVSRDTPHFERFKQPVLVIGASNGTFTSADKMQSWIKGLENGAFCVVSCFHWPLTECPQEVSHYIEVWIRREFE